MALERFVDAEGHIFSVSAEEAKRRGLVPYKAPESKAQAAPQDTKMISGPAQNKGRG